MRADSLVRATLDIADNLAHGRATCPVTENGFIRVLASPAYGGVEKRVSDLTARLRRFCGSDAHRFWPDGVSLTDVCLLGEAVKHGGRLATFDRAIPVKAVVGARAGSLVVIEP